MKKGTKRSMFFTTLAVVVLLVTAVATATWAWFSVSGSVGSDTTVLQAASVEGANIGIGWNIGDAKAGNADIEFKDQSEAKIQPMVPVANIISIGASKTSATALSTANSFNTGIINPASGKFASRANCNPYLFTAKDTPDTVIFLSNNDVHNGVEVDMTIIVTGGREVGKELYTALRLAICVNDEVIRVVKFNGAGASYYGLIGEDDDPTTMATMTTSAAETLSIVDSGPAYSATIANICGLTGSSLGLSAQARVQIFAWFDGAALTNTNSGTNMSISFSFSGRLDP